MPAVLIVLVCKLSIYIPLTHLVKRSAGKGDSERLEVPSAYAAIIRPDWNSCEEIISLCVYSYDMHVPAAVIVSVCLSARRILGDWLSHQLV